ncbi:MAG TPA: HAD family hydrolase [Humibacter sp.]|nr:HAD family hydrolase [Humibacter sp.]
MTDALPAAVLWDMDGTLVDTEPYWMRAETELVSSFGGIWTHDDGLALVGSGLWASARVFQSRGVALSEDEIVARLTDRVQQQLAENGVPWRAGARELLLELREASVPTALVTMSVRRMAEQIAEQIPFDAFDVLVTGDEVENAKPHPDPYLTAARLLEVDPAECIAIEDSLNGLASAVAAGTVAIGVPHMIPLPTGDEHTVWPTLQGRTRADLIEVLRIAMAERAAQESTR